MAFSKLNEPSSFNLSLDLMSSSLLTNLVAICWICYNSSPFFLYWKYKNRMQCSKWGLTSAEEKSMINSLSLTSTCIKCVPRCGWLSSLQRQTVVTCSACFPPFCRAVSTQLGPSVYCYLGLFHHRFRTLHYLLLNFHKIPVGLFFHPVQTSLKKTPTLQLTDCFP